MEQLQNIIDRLSLLTNNASIRIAHTDRFVSIPFAMSLLFEHRCNLLEASMFMKLTDDQINNPGLTRAIGHQAARNFDNLARVITANFCANGAVMIAECTQIAIQCNDVVNGLNNMTAKELLKIIRDGYKSIGTLLNGHASPILDEITAQLDPLSELNADAFDDVLVQEANYLDTIGANISSNASTAYLLTECLTDYQQRKYCVNHCRGDFYSYLNMYTDLVTTTNPNLLFYFGHQPTRSMFPFFSDFVTYFFQFIPFLFDAVFSNAIEATLKSILYYVNAPFLSRALSDITASSILLRYSFGGEKSDLAILNSSTKVIGTKFEFTGPSSNASSDLEQIMNNGTAIRLRQQIRSTLGFRILCDTKHGMYPLNRNDNPTHWIFLIIIGLICSLGYYYPFEVIYFWVSVYCFLSAVMLMFLLGGHCAENQLSKWSQIFTFLIASVIQCFLCFSLVHKPHLMLVVFVVFLYYSYSVSIKEEDEQLENVLPITELTFFDVTGRQMSAATVGNTDVLAADISVNNFVSEFVKPAKTGTVSEYIYDKTVAFGFKLFYNLTDLASLIYVIPMGFFVRVFFTNKLKVDDFVVTAAARLYAERDSKEPAAFSVSSHRHHLKKRLRFISEHLLICLTQYAIGERLGNNVSQERDLKQIPLTKELNQLFLHNYFSNCAGKKIMIMRELVDYFEDYKQKAKVTGHLDQSTFNRFRLALDYLRMSSTSTDTYFVNTLMAGYMYPNPISKQAKAVSVFLISNNIPQICDDLNNYPVQHTINALLAGFKTQVIERLEKLPTIYLEDYWNYWSENFDGGKRKTKIAMMADIRNHVLALTTRAQVLEIWNTFTTPRISM